MLSDVRELLKHERDKKEESRGRKRSIHRNLLCCSSGFYTAHTKTGRKTRVWCGRCVCVVGVFFWCCVLCGCVCVFVCVCFFVSVCVSVCVFVFVFVFLCVCVCV